ncbi:hypothetical protein NM688_g9098 [Phlebia brevispora]|uniref:Uncharacterized protein n=1 Tax=Phlebia brevispora TaxID=194682 RepID=A0ACC1RNR4_9APHY|nr:hypothetical protein NM688_g9098 [Phlebia brevispora]
MAVPNEMTTLNLSGKYYQNKTLSDDTDEILRLQGVSWWVRKAIQLGTLYVTITHRTEDGVEKMTIDQVLTGGAGSSTEERVLDWEERKVDDRVFGPIISRTKREFPENIEKEYLKTGFINDGHGLVMSYGASDTEKSGTTWVGETTWGIEELDVGENKEKRYTRHVFFTGPGGEEITARVVYDYTGPLD